MARIAIALIALPAFALAGCAPAPTVDDGRVQVVASTNVYGSIAEAIGGDHVAVTSLITNAAQDPHSFEASAQDQLTLSKADLVIENGGGYDPFIDTLLNATSSTAVVVSASEASGLLEGASHEDEEEGHEEEAHEGETAEEHDAHAHIEGFNEHVWYSIHGVSRIAEELEHELSELDPENAGDYAENLAAFTLELEKLEAQVESLHAAAEGQSVAITEPVPFYLLDDIGLDNTTPADFSEAIEEGTDVSPAVLNETLGVVSDVVLLAYNSQTASAETEKVREAAESAGVPIVEFSETLPDGEDYISWMTANVSAISAALE